MTEMTVEVGERTFKAKPTVLRDGAERERLYAALTEYWPDTKDYEKNSDGRAFAVIVLAPVA